MDTRAGEGLRDRFTVGVEEEYQLIDPATAELRSSSGVVRRADLTGELVGEVKETMLEIGTPVCRDAVELAARLRERRFQAAAAAATEDLEIVAAGTHPFSRGGEQRLSPEPRPRMLARLFRQLLWQQSIWGMHIHVAVPADVDRVKVMNTVRTFGPHLLALSCSSPFQHGLDTGFSSFRAISWRGYPFAGVPPRFASEEEYGRYLALLIEAGTIPDPKTVYWSVRPSPRYPTLELRMCDACPRIGDAVALAALGRAVVVAAAEEAIQPLGASLSAPLQDEILRENEWIAARDGLGATLIAPERPGRQVPVREAIGDLLVAVEPVAVRLGDTAALGGIETILEKGNAADRMRARLVRGDSARAVVRWLVEETRAGTGLDRRLETREAADASVSLSKP